MPSRRAFLKSGGIAVFGIGLGGLPVFMTRTAAAVTAPGAFSSRKVLVLFSSAAPWTA